MAGSGSGIGETRQSAAKREPGRPEAQQGPRPECLRESHVLTKAQAWPSEAQAALLTAADKACLWVVGTSKLERH